MPCVHGMRAARSNNEISILPTAVALLLAWMGYQYFAGGESDDEEADSKTNTMYT
jgi:hypothetical protein